MTELSTNSALTLTMRVTLMTVKENLTMLYHDS